MQIESLYERDLKLHELFLVKIYVEDGFNEANIS